MVVELLVENTYEQDHRSAGNLSHQAQFLNNGRTKGIKAFSDWPTVPQLYVKGEFVGGCDIVREMYETGELAELLMARGVKRAAVSA